MEFFYNLFKYTRKTCVIITSIVTFALIIGLVVCAYYLRDGTFVQSIINSFKEVIDATPDAGASLPESFMKINKGLIENADKIKEIANIVFIAGIAFVSSFLFVYVFSGLLAFAHQKQIQKVFVVNAEKINA